MEIQRGIPPSNRPDKGPVELFSDTVSGWNVTPPFGLSDVRDVWSKKSNVNIMYYQKQTTPVKMHRT